MTEISNSKQYKKLLLKGQATVYIDWANVYGWRKSLKQEVDEVKLYEYLRQYQEILDVRLYHGTDVHPKSKEFLDRSEEIGYAVITKPVKYIRVGQVGDQQIRLRKCDFDIEVSIDVHQAITQGFASLGDFSL